VCVCVFLRLGAINKVLFFGGTGVRTHGFTLAKQSLYCLNHTSSPFCSGYFGDGGLENYMPRLVSNCDPPHLSLSCS
jgi:hypothetical protein